MIRIGRIGIILPEKKFTPFSDQILVKDGITCLALQIKGPRIKISLFFSAQLITGFLPVIKTPPHINTMAPIRGKNLLLNKGIQL